MKRHSSIVIIFILILLGVGGFIIYNNVIKSAKMTFTDDELNNYLNYVPFFDEYMNDEDLEYHYGYKKDAYSGQSVNISNLDERLLMANTYRMTDKVDIVEEVTGSFCGEEDSCVADEYVAINTFNENLKKFYNVSKTNSSSFGVKAGEVYLTDNYYVTWYGRGSSPLKKVNKLINYEYDNNDLIIYEKAAFTFELDVSAIVISKLTNHSQTDTEKVSMNNWQDAETYIKNNFDKFNTFKHTFKLGKNKEYYYYGTEIGE